MRTNMLQSCCGAYVIHQFFDTVTEYRLHPTEVDAYIKEQINIYIKESGRALLLATLNGRQYKN